MILKRIADTLILLLVTVISTAQAYRSSCALDSVTESGFYRIQVTPELSSYLKTDMSDLRITDEKDQQIPYIIDNPFENSGHHSVLFDLKILKSEKTGIRNNLVIENNRKDSISNFILKMKNTSADRFASLSGSDNLQDWFTIVDSLLINTTPSGENVNNNIKINFPLTNYRYFKLSVENKGKNPFQFLSAYNEGIPNSKDTIEQYIQNPDFKFSQTDTTGFSLLTIIPQQSWHFNRLDVFANQPKFYNRTAKLFTSSAGTIGTLLTKNPFSEFLLSSNNYNGIMLPNTLKADTLYILIENKDNPPLRVNKITSHQHNLNIVTWLEPGHCYKLLLNNPGSKTPDYDLSVFKNEINKNGTFLNAGKINATEDVNTNPVLVKTNSLWLWSVIILVILITGALAWKLAKEMKKKA